LSTQARTICVEFLKVPKLPQELWTLIGEALVRTDQRPSLKQLIGYAHTFQALRQGVLPALERVVVNKITIIKYFKTIKKSSRANYSVHKWCKGKVVSEAFQRSPFRLTTDIVENYIFCLRRALGLLKEDPQMNIEWGITVMHLHLNIMGAFE
jgi:hypothetical protein